MNQARIERVLRATSILDNPAVAAQESHSNRAGFYQFTPPLKHCGCGRVAAYAVYKDKQPHCKSCVYDAIDSDEQVLVGRL